MKKVNKFRKMPASISQHDLVLSLLFFTAMALDIWAIGIYRLTIIPMRYLLVPMVFGGVLIYWPLAIFLKSSYSAFWQFFIKVGIGCSVVYFGLLFLNKQFAADEMVTASFPIVNKSSLARGKGGACRQPVADIAVDGLVKELVFHCDDDMELQKATTIELTYSSGLWGFPVIKVRKLLP